MSHLRVYWTNCARCETLHKEVEGNRDVLCEKCREDWYKCVEEHKELEKVHDDEHDKLIAKIWDEFLKGTEKVKVQFT